MLCKAVFWDLQYLREESFASDTEEDQNIFGDGSVEVGETKERTL